MAASKIHTVAHILVVRCCCRRQTFVIIIYIFMGFSMDFSRLQFVCVRVFCIRFQATHMFLITQIPIESNIVATFHLMQTIDLCGNFA